MVENNFRVRTGVLLAAGRGLRLYPLTREMPKCLVCVNKKSILERLMNSLDRYGIERLIVVTGYKAHRIRQVLGNRYREIDVSYVHNDRFETTNNIYSLYLAAKRITSPFLLMESDIVFHPGLLEKMMFTDRIALAHPASWMSGSCVAVNEGSKVVSFQDQLPDRPDPAVKKTVNLYSFSEQSWRRIKKQLEQEIVKGNTDLYYETVFKPLVKNGQLALKGVLFEAGAWYEIDTLEDLAAAERLFVLKREVENRPGYNEKRVFQKTEQP
jgi:NDP-sugar pyrophosphorylase family protein